MKKFISAIIIAIFFMLSCTSVLADSSNDTTIVYLTFDMIEELILENNPDVGFNERSLELVVNEKNSLPDEDDDDFDENVIIQRINYEKSILQIEKSNYQIVKNAQDLYMDYNSIILDYNEKAVELELKEKELDLLKLKETLGIVKKEDVDTAEAQIENLRTQLQELDEQKREIIEEMNQLLGQDYDIELEIGPVPDFDMELISDLDYDKDWETILQNSYSYITALYDYQKTSNELDQIENTFGEDSEEYKEAEIDFDKAIISLEETKEKIQKSFEDYFENLKDLESNLVEEKENLISAKEDYELANLKYYLGMIDELEKENERMKYFKQVLSVERAELNLFKAYMEYQWMIRGIS